MCIFCKIINKEIPATIIYEDDEFISFLDIAPVNKGHFLVLPKQHISHFNDLSEELLSKLLIITQKITKQLMTKIKPDAFNIVLNDGKVAGQEVPHLHFHVLPRYKTDDFDLLVESKKTYSDGEIEEYKEKLTINFIK